MNKSILQPITICGLPTSGKSILYTLLDGHHEIYSLPMFHDSISALLCLYNTYFNKNHVEHNEKLHGGMNNAYFLRHLLIKYGDYYRRLEIISRNKSFHFHIDSNNFIIVPVEFDLNFLRLDNTIMTLVLNTHDISPINIFNIIYKSLFYETDNNMNIDKIKYCISMSDNRLTDYEEIINTYPDGKLLFVNRNIIDAIGSQYLRTFIYSKAQSFSSVMNHKDNIDMLHEYILLYNKAKLLSKKYPESMRIIDFEDLFTNTEQTMRSLMSWLGLKFDPILTKITFHGKYISHSHDILSKIRDKMTDKLSVDDYMILQEHIKNAQQKHNHAEEYIIQSTTYSLAHRFTAPLRRFVDILRQVLTLIHTFLETVSRR